MSRRDRWYRRRARDAKRWMNGELLTSRVPRRVTVRSEREWNGEDAEPDGSVDEVHDKAYRRRAKPAD